MCAAKLVACFPWYAAIGILPCEIRIAGDAEANKLTSTVLTGTMAWKWKNCKSGSGTLLQKGVSGKIESCQGDDDDDDDDDDCNGPYRWFKRRHPGGCVWRDLLMEEGGPRFVLVLICSGIAIPALLNVWKQGSWIGWNVSASFFLNIAVRKCFLNRNLSMIVPLW